MSDTIDPGNPSGKVQRRRHRGCIECGAVLDVTALFGGRKYRCAHCGAIFRYDVSDGRPREEVKPRRAPFWPRLIAAPVLIALMVWLVAIVAQIQIADAQLFMVACGGAFIGTGAVLGIRTWSCDSAAYSGVVLTTGGLATLVLIAVADTVPLERMQAVSTAMMVWLGLGGFMLARFITNRGRLTVVGANGIVQ